MIGVHQSLTPRCQAHCTLHTAQCTLHNAQCTLHSAQGTLHTAHTTELTFFSFVINDCSEFKTVFENILNCCPNLNLTSSIIYKFILPTV